jgi:hypothetical protein
MNWQHPELNPSVQTLTIGVLLVLFRLHMDHVMYVVMKREYNVQQEKQYRISGDK